MNSGGSTRLAAKTSTQTSNHISTVHKKIRVLSRKVARYRTFTISSHLCRPIGIFFIVWWGLSLFKSAKASSYIRTSQKETFSLRLFLVNGSRSVNFFRFFTFPQQFSRIGRSIESNHRSRFIPFLTSKRHEKPSFRSPRWTRWYRKRSFLTVGFEMVHYIGDRSKSSAKRSRSNKNNII